MRGNRDGSGTPAGSSELRSGGPTGTPRGPLRLYPLLALVPVLTAVGQFDEAESAIHGAGVEMDHAGGTAWADAPPVFRARVHLAAGRLDVAKAGAAEALAIADRLGNDYFAPLAVSCLAVVPGVDAEAPRSVGIVRRSTDNSPSPFPAFDMRQRVARFL